MAKLPVLAFRCPNGRFKPSKQDVVECQGFMAAQTLDSTKGKFLLYCSKCGKFYIAAATDGIYHLKEVNKNELQFIDMPYTFTLDE
jgi:hypothetical protein